MSRAELLGKRTDGLPPGWPANVGPERNAPIQSIEEAAVATSYFEQARFHRRTAETRLNDALQTSQPSSLAITATVKTMGFRIRPKCAPEGSTFGPEAERNGRDHDFIIGYNNAHGGSGHWLTRKLPAIDRSLRQQRVCGVRLVPPPLNVRAPRSGSQHVCIMQRTGRHACRHSALWLTFYAAENRIRCSEWRGKHGGYSIFCV